MPFMNRDLVRECAKSKELSYRDIGDHLDVDRTTVAKWMTGASNIPSQYVIPLADLLGITADMLLREPSKRGAA